MNWIAPGVVGASLASLVFLGGQNIGKSPEYTSSLSETERIETARFYFPKEYPDVFKFLDSHHDDPMRKVPLTYIRVCRDGPETYNTVAPKEVHANDIAQVLLRCGWLRTQDDTQVWAEHKREELFNKRYSN